MAFKILKTIIIPGEAISKKRNIMPIRLGKHMSIAPTKRWTVYEQMALGSLIHVDPLPSDTTYPVYLHIWHYRKTKRMFDYLNMAQAACDLLQGNIKTKDPTLRHRIIPEDDVNHCIPVHESPFAGWSVDKNHPRTVITITTDPYYLMPTDITCEGLMKLLERKHNAGPSKK